MLYLLSSYLKLLAQLLAELAIKSVELAMRKGLTIYDASYATLADLIGTELYTADEKLIRKVRSDRVKHIADLEL